MKPPKSKLQLPDLIDVTFALCQPPRNAQLLPQHSQYTFHQGGHPTLRGDAGSRTVSLKWSETEPDCSAALVGFPVTDAAIEKDASKIGMSFLKAERFPPVVGHVWPLDVYGLNKFSHVRMVLVDEKLVPKKFRDYIGALPPSNGPTKRSHIVQLECQGKLLTVGLNNHGVGFAGTEKTSITPGGPPHTPIYPKLPRGARCVLAAPPFDPDARPRRQKVPKGLKGEDSDYDDYRREAKEDYVRQLWRIIPVSVPKYWTTPVVDGAPVEQTYQVTMIQSVYNGAFMTIHDTAETLHPRLIVRPLIGNIWTREWTVADEKQVNIVRQAVGVGSRQPDESEGSDEDKPKPKPKARRRRKVQVSSSESDDDDEGDTYKTRTFVPNRTSSRPARAARVKAEAKVAQLDQVYEVAGVARHQKPEKDMLKDDARFQPVPAAPDHIQREYHWISVMTTNQNNMRDRFNRKIRGDEGVVHGPILDSLDTQVLAATIAADGFLPDDDFSDGFLEDFSEEI